MTEYDYPVAFSAWDDSEYAAIARVTASGRFTQGPEVEAFEAEFAAFHGMKHAIAVNSGSSANLVAVAALFHKKHKPLQRSNRVLVPALAWATTYAPLVQHGLWLKLLDCAEHWNAIARLPDGNGARLVVGCSVLGNPAPERSWRHYADKIGAYFLVDNCETLGGWFGPLGETRYCGTFGHLNTFSFYHSHQMSAIEGGCILTDDDELNGLCRMLRDHGMTRYLKPQTFDGEYDFRLMGYNVRWVEMHAAIAREQLKKLDRMCVARQQNFNNFETACTGLPIQVPPKLGNAVRSPFGFNFTVESKDVRAKLVAAFRSASIDCRLPTGGSFLRHPYSTDYRGEQRTPNADRIHDTGLFLGLAPFEMNDKIERAVKIMKETL